MRYRGDEAVGVADVCREADVRKGSFYHFFDSKAALAFEQSSAIDTFHRFGEQLAASLTLKLAVEGAISGCRFGNFALELANTDEAIRCCVSHVFDEMAATFAIAIEAGQTSGELAADVDPTAIALTLLAQMEGLLLLAKAKRDPAIVSTFGATAERLLR
ncbi:MAG: TetR family transcriptional regulator C-terminal domain-containing protein [Acidimicrobiales bacterium]